MGAQHTFVPTGRQSTLPQQPLTVEMLTGTAKTRPRSVRPRRRVGWVVSGAGPVLVLLDGHSQQRRLVVCCVVVVVCWVVVVVCWVV